MLQNLAQKQALYSENIIRGTSIKLQNQAQKLVL